MNDDFGLGLSDYGARWFDASVGRWWSVDPMAEKYASWSPYNYVQNTPINAVDPDGRTCVGCGSNGENLIQPGNSSTTAWPPNGGKKGDTFTDSDGSFVHNGQGWIDQSNGNGVIPVVDILPSTTIETSATGNTPGYTTTIPEGNGTNWLSRATIATQNKIGTTDVSALYRFSDEMPGYLRNTAGALFLVGGLVDVGFSLTLGQQATKEVGKFKFPGANPTKAPKGFEWKGRPGSKPGSKDGNWYNPKTGESLRPDLNHPEPINPHWDYRDPSGKWWRIFQDGSNVPK